MSAELAVLDTNVLVNSVYDQAEHFAASRALLETAKSEDAGLCLLPQNVAEFYAAVTNAKRVSEPKPPEIALAAIDDFLALPGITLLPVPSDIVDRLLALLRRRPVTATKVYDLQLIAAMLGNGVTRVYTFNSQDFEPFEEIDVLVPEVPAAGRIAEPAPESFKND